MQSGDSPISATHISGSVVYGGYFDLNSQDILFAVRFFFGGGVMGGVLFSFFYGRGSPPPRYFYVVVYCPQKDTDHTFRYI